MPETYENIHRFLNSPDWTWAEKWVIRWQYRMLSDFQTALADAIKHADEENLQRLALGFPEQVAGYKAWAWGDLGRRLREAGLGI